MTSNIKPHELYRTKEQIISDVLKAIQEHEPNGLQKIHLIYYARLSSGQLKQYLPYLMDNSLLTVDYSTSVTVAPSKTDPRKNRTTTRGDTIHITQKGKEYLSILKEQKSLGIKI